MKDQAVFFIMAIIYLAILYSLVRPGSTGTKLVSTIGTTLSDVVRGVAGQTYDTQTKKWSTSG